ncbi:phosphatidylserine decarboxylase [Rhodotorula sphaerocarpa]
MSSIEEMEFFNRRGGKASASSPAASAGASVAGDPPLAAPPPASIAADADRATPVPAQKRSLLSRIPVKGLKQIPRAAAAGPRRLARLRGAAQRRRDLFKPLKEGDEPLGTLVVQVHAGRNLVAKDKNGLSDPYLVIRYGSSRITSPTATKTLNPVWVIGGESGAVEGAGGEAKLEVKVFDSLAFGMERIEIVGWDRDRVSSEYLGEISIGLEDWWGSPDEWQDGVPPFGFFDDQNKPVWHTLRSSRSRSTVSGDLLVQVGFVPYPTSPDQRTLSPEQRTRIVDALRRVRNDVELLRRTSREDRVFLAPPTAGVGTALISSDTLLGEAVSDPDDSDAASSTGSHSSGTESDDEETASESDAALTGGTGTEVGATGYFDESLKPAAGPLADWISNADGPLMGEPLAKSPSPETMVVPPPRIEVELDDEAVPASSADASQSDLAAPPTARTSSRRGLALPGFVKRRFSSSTMTSRTTTEPSKPAAVESEDGLTDEASTPSGLTADKPSRRKRFSRKKRSPAPESELAEALIEMNLTAGPSGISASSADEQASGKRTRTRRSGEGKRRHRRHRSAAGYTFGGDERIAGLVQVEITSAKDLPPFRNALRTGFDMDPFCVISFGRKVFRTRVIRHSLNPVWEERLFFHVGEAETHWNIGFSVSDWDKITGNDHVGDVVVPLEDLLGETIQPDERGLYATSPDGKLLGADFRDHHLPIASGNGENHYRDAKPSLQIRACYLPYAALRQQFWRVYAMQYAIGEQGRLSYVELFSMLDSLGSTLCKDTIEAFFTRFKKTAEDELTLDEVVLCLEDEVRKPQEEKRHIEDSAGSGSGTPAGPGGGPAAGDFTDPEPAQPRAFDQTDVSSDMKTIAPGTKALTDPEHGTVVEAPEPAGRVKPPLTSRASSTSDGPESSTDTNIERVVNIKECPLCRKPRLNKKGEVSIITHLGICASTDPTRVNRVLVSNFVTASQAQRKFLFKMLGKVTKGQYALGADSANIIVQDRQTGAFLEEKMAVYVRLGIRLMYRGMSGNMEGARIRRMLDSLTKKQGLKYDSPASVKDIEPFIRFHNLNLNEVLDPLPSFKTFNEFFYRKLKADARPVADPEDPRTVVSCADCRAMFFQTIDEATSIWIKGREFTIGRMLGDYYRSKAPEYDGGSLAIFRLAPQDYHRYHSPVDGIMGKHEYISGQYYTVNPMAIRSSVSVYSDNVRLVANVESPVFGDVMNVWVGAMMVASIHMTKEEGEDVKRGDELGYFAFGGSTIVVLFKPNTVKFDEDLLANSRNSIETLIRVGTRIGRAVD